MRGGGGACTVAVAVVQMQAGHKGAEEPKVHFGLVRRLRSSSTHQVL